MTDHTVPFPIPVALDVGPLYGHRTGVGVAVDGIAQGLAERDDVVVEPYLVSTRSTPRNGHRKLPIPGIVASHVWSRADRPRADRLMGDAAVVHGTNYTAPPTSLPTVVSVYDCWFLEHDDLASAVVRRAGDTLRRAARRGAWIHTSSDATAERARSLLDTERVSTVPLGPPPTPPSLADLDRPRIADTIDGRPFVVAVGTEERRKGLPLLIEAFAIVAARHADPLLVLAGATGDDSSEVIAAIRNLPGGVRERVVRLGPVDEPTKHWLLRQASTLAYPSLDEGFGFPVLEAQMVGTPVVACRVGSIPEVAGTGADLIDGRDSEAFADAVERVLTDGATRLLLAEAGHRNAGRFSWTATVDGIVGMYRRAIVERR